LANIKQQGVPIMLTPGFTFPDALKANEAGKYRLYNPDDKQIGISITMISGFIDLYVSDKSTLSE